MRILHTYLGLCECDTEFEYVDDSVLSYLDVGVLLGTLPDEPSVDCVFDGYLIDWYYETIDDPPVFQSGEGSDPEIDFTHPFAEPVEAGTYIPQIRYVIIDGVRYYASGSADCLLSEVVVECMTCDNGIRDGYGYDHVVDYVNTIDPPEKATRTIRFCIDSDTTMFAFYFAAIDIADRIEIWHVSGAVETKVRDWVVGADNAGYNGTSTPKLWDDRYFRSIIVFSELGITPATDDYLRITITPSYNDPGNTNTNWTLYMRCFDTVNPIDCDVKAPDIWDVDASTFVMTWNNVTCHYELRFQTADGFILAWHDLYKYLRGSIYAGAYATYDPDSPSGSGQYFDAYSMIRFPKNENGSAAYCKTFNPCINLDGTMTIRKVSDVLTYEFTDEADYLIYKAGYADTLTNVWWLAYSSDPEDEEHYIYIYDHAHEAESCGDEITYRYNSIAHEAGWAFDDVNFKITITLVEVTVGYIDTDCSTVYETIVQRMAQVNSFYNTADFVRTTKVGKTNPFPPIRIYGNFSEITEQADAFIRYSVPEIQLEEPVCDIADWCDDYSDSSKGTYLSLYHYRLHAKITNTGDPINNFDVWNRLDTDGCTILDPEVLIYSIKGASVEYLAMPASMKTVGSATEFMASVDKLAIATSEKTVGTPTEYIAGVGYLAIPYSGKEIIGTIT